jgi:hypothetical protein
MCQAGSFYGKTGKTAETQRAQRGTSNVKFEIESETI